MEISPQNLQQKLLVLMIATAKESLTIAAITKARSICVLFQLLIKQVHRVVYMRKRHKVTAIARVFVVESLFIFICKYSYQFY